jgi:hypothetical protein
LLDGISIEAPNVFPLSGDTAKHITLTESFTCCTQLNTRFPLLSVVRKGQEVETAVSGEMEEGSVFPVWVLTGAVAHAANKIPVKKSSDK